MRHGRRTAALVLTLGLGLSTAACGGGNTVADPTKSSSATSTPTPTPSPAVTPTPSPTVKPLSKFEDQAPVKVARQWAAALATDVNNKNKAYPASKSVATKRAAGQMNFYGGEDFGLVYPGPLPFTPTRVRVVGSTATLDVCVWAQGWAQDPQTKLPARKRQIRPNDLVVKKVGGVWKFDQLLESQGGCSNVPVKGTPG